MWTNWALGCQPSLLYEWSNWSHCALFFYCPWEHTLSRAGKKACLHFGEHRCEHCWWMRTLLMWWSWGSSYWQHDNGRIWRAAAIAPHCSRALRSVMWQQATIRRSQAGQYFFFFLSSSLAVFKFYLYLFGEEVFLNHLLWGKHTVHIIFGCNTFPTSERHANCQTHLGLPWQVFLGLN